MKICALVHTSAYPGIPFLLRRKGSWTEGVAGEEGHVAGRKGQKCQKASFFYCPTSGAGRIHQLVKEQL